ncbi:MAG: hypothetical protein OXP73_01870 [Chloroflexota bacterium]|nr:hypothetical protein [Chloroflexota bacterium]
MLCPTGSGSGYWLGFVEDQGVVFGLDHIPYAGGGLRVYAHGGRLVFVSWPEGALRVRTRYADGKPYVFRVENGAIEWENR